MITNIHYRRNIEYIYLVEVLMLKGRWFYLHELVSCTAREVMDHRRHSYMFPVSFLDRSPRNKRCFLFFALICECSCSKNKR